MKKVLLTVSLILLLVISGIVVNYFQDKEAKIDGNQNFQSAVDAGVATVLIGSSTDLKKLPASYVFSNTTTTDATYDGGAVNQFVLAKGAKTLRISGKMLGASASSTLSIRPQVSMDNSNWFDILMASSTLNYATTSSVVLPTVIVIQPGVTVTTTFSTSLEIPATDYVRFVLKGSEDEGVANDEWTQAWLQVIKESER